MKVYIVYFDSPHHEPVMYADRDAAVGVAGEHWCDHDKAKVRVLRFDMTIYHSLDECRHAMNLHLPWTSVHGFMIWKDGKPVE